LCAWNPNTIELTLLSFRNPLVTRVSLWTHENLTIGPDEFLLPKILSVIEDCEWCYIEIAVGELLHSKKLAIALLHVSPSMCQATSEMEERIADYQMSKATAAE